MELLWGELLALSIFFGGMVLAKFRLLRMVIVLCLFAGVIDYFLYKGVFLLVLAALFSLVEIAWKVKLSKWNEG